MILFPNEVTFRGSGVRISMYLLGDNAQPTADKPGEIAPPFYFFTPRAKETYTTCKIPNTIITNPFTFGLRVFSLRAIL